LSATVYSGGRNIKARLDPRSLISVESTFCSDRRTARPGHRLPTHSICQESSTRRNRCRSSGTQHRPQDHPQVFGPRRSLPGRFHAGHESGEVSPTIVKR
jgi:hypothetical protein